MTQSVMAGDNHEERQARSLALEKAYVHDVYDQIAPHFTDTRYRPWPRVKQFLLELEPGSLVADVGCGNGKYLDINPDLMKIGTDRCAALTAAARAKNFEVLTSDNLHMPFRDETFDAVLSIAVIHHFATTDRRVAAIKELTRVLRIGGKVLITVWAMEQRHRKFDSQDVLVPWHEPVKSSSEDRGSSVERELTSTTTSDDDVLVYHAYSHISDSESHQHSAAVSKKRQKYRNGRGRYRSADSAMHCRRANATSSQSSSELSSPNETCYSFVRRAFQKLSNSTASGSPYDTFAKKSPPTPYFYRSCRKPCVSESMEFGKYNKDSAPGSPKKEFCHQDSLDSEYPDPTTEEDVPIELRHLEGYETCKKCGTPTDFGYTNCEQKVCASCLPADPDTGKKSRSLGDFLNMIPKLLRVKKCEKEPMSDLHKRISTASDPREYVVKTRGNEVNGIVRSKSTVSMMSRLEELMSMSPTSGKDEPQTVANPNCSAGPRSRTKPSLLQSFTSTVLVEGSDGTIEIRDSSEIKNLRRYNSPADALHKLRQDVALDEPFDVLKKNDGEKEINSCVEKKLQNNDYVVKKKKSSLKSSNSTSKETNNSEKRFDVSTIRPIPQRNNTEVKPEEEDSEGHLSSYYSMPELYKLAIDQIPEEPIVTSPKQRHISFFEQAQNIFADTSSESNDLSSRRRDSSLNYTTRERTSVSIPQRGLVKRSLSVDTGDNSSSSHQAPRRFSASAAQGVMATSLRNCSIPRSCSRGSSVKSDTSVDSEESIVSVIPRKGNSITSDTSVDSEESVISVIQRSTSEIDTLFSQNGLRNNISRFGSRSAQASPVTVLSSQTSSAESSPPQSGKNDGRFPGSVGVIDQLMQQQQLLYSTSDVLHSKTDGFDHPIRVRRCLLRPISDPKIEEKLISQDEFSNTLGNKLSNSVQMPNSNPDTLPVLEGNKTLIKEKIVVAKPSVAQNPPVKPLIADAEPNWKVEKKEQADGELSKTPSPVGPFQYITDPLITGIETTIEAPTETDKAVVSASETELKTKSIRFNTEITNLEQKIATLPEIRKPPNGIIESVLRNAITKKGIVEVNSSDTDQIVAVASTSFDVQDHISVLPEELQDLQDPKELQSNQDESSVSNINTGSTSDDLKMNKNKDNDMRKSFFKLRERLESLASSQNSMPNFEIFKNVSHSFGSLRNIKEKIESETSNDSLRENKISPTPKSLNDSRQSSLDESSQVTLSDESVMSVEGTSSVSDENDYKKTDDDEENLDSSQNLTVKKADEDRVVTSAATAPQNVLTDARQSSQKHCQTKKCESCAHKPSKAASFSDTELHLKKTGVRCPLRKRLRRSCVTIDEVECPEFVSSEDTSPSSSVSLEWNDFDKLDAESSACTACCSSCGIPTITEGDMPRDEPSIAICCEDVNVAETETKFNIVDKEMCVFFETPSSSIGKSASSSSNATDFSTTSDRFRGVMQREKSDDRSSKESDSDNLSKLSDVEGRSDSVFSEDFAKKTDLASSSSSVSLDVLESMRAKLNNDAECEGVSGSSKQTSNWVLDNIDEIPDDDQSHEDTDQQIGGVDKSLSSISWKPEKSMDFAQRRENFLSCAADCRDMYRITFDDKSKAAKENVSRSCSVTSSEIQEPIMMGMAIPDIAPSLMELFPPRKNPEDDERSTGILAELVGTISGISSLAFGDVYPKQEVKIEEVSSDESVGISTFEKVLTSGATTHSKSRPRKSSSHQKEKGLEEPSEKRSNNKKSSTNGHDSNSTNNHSGSLKDEMKNMGPAFVKLPPENGPRVNSELSKDKVKGQELERNIQNSESKAEETINGSNTPQPIQNEKKKPEKLKILNRTSQSVCLDRIRQSSFEKDDESLQSTQSAPCSPRMKPRQRSVEEVLSSSRNELSRNSSLSQSTSQESLPGNETGGLMSYHRYYHVFRQGELDNLIETHVDNLHIISSYYDHANWCVVAEKVQVWTI